MPQRMFIKELFLGAPAFFLFISSLRCLWWGIGSQLFDLYFIVDKLNYLTLWPQTVVVTLLGLLGISGGLTKSYAPSIIFAILNVFLMAEITFYFMAYTPRNITGTAYFIELLAAIWLVFRIQYDRSKTLRYKQYSE